MINPELQKARKVRDEYAAHNLNTKYQSVRIDARTVVFKRIEIDENAVKFAEKLKKLEKAEAIEKRVNKVQPNAKKAKPKPKPKPKEKADRKPKGLSDTSLRGQIYSDFIAGMDKDDIAKKYNVSLNRVRSEIGKRERFLGIPSNRERRGVTYSKVVDLIKKGLSNGDIAKELSITKRTVTYHKQKMKTKTKEKQ